MDFENYLDEAARKNALTFIERIKRALDEAGAKHSPSAVHAYALKHRITNPEEAVEIYAKEA